MFLIRVLVLLALFTSSAWAMSDSEVEERISRVIGCSVTLSFVTPFAPARPTVRQPLLAYAPACTNEQRQKGEAMKIRLRPLHSAPPE